MTVSFHPISVSFYPISVSFYFIVIPPNISDTDLGRMTLILGGIHCFLDCITCIPLDKTVSLHPISVSFVLLRGIHVIPLTIKKTVSFHPISVSFVLSRGIHVTTIKKTVSFHPISVSFGTQYSVILPNITCHSTQYQCHSTNISVIPPNISVIRFVRGIHVT